MQKNEEVNTWRVNIRRLIHADVLEWDSGGNWLDHGTSRAGRNSESKSRGAGDRVVVDKTLEKPQRVV